MLAIIAADGLLGEAISVLVLTAALAAIMSTADSALLSLSSMVARDMIGELRPDLDEARLAKIGKLASWAIIVVMVVMAIRPPTTLWRLIEIKMELLIQVAPAFLLGVRYQQLDSDTVFRGVVVGASLAMIAFFADIQRIAGIHAGTYACAINFAICWQGIRASHPASRPPIVTPPTPDP